MARRTRYTNVEIDLSGRLLTEDVRKIVDKTTRKQIVEMADLGLQLAISAWSDKSRYVRTIGRFPSHDRPYAIVRSRYYGRPYPRNATAAAAGGPLLSYWLDRGVRGGTRLRRGYYRWKTVGAAINALDKNRWFADPIAAELNR